MGTPLVVDLDDAERATDPALTGRKAATLARLRAAGHPVPPGVVVTVATRPAGSDDVVPPAVLAGLEAAVRTWGTRVAVRSSGVAEDGAEASFAGLYATVLDVDEAALADAVRTCWASAGAERVRSYAGGPGAPLAVLVQPMVAAAAAGVAFTADPVTGERDVVVVDAVAGLGESLVSGERTPARWRVRAGRAEHLSGPGDVVDADGVRAVADLATAVVDTLDAGPQDVEWAMAADGSVHLLQARPVTALPVEPVPVPVEVPPGSWFREASHSPVPWSRFMVPIWAMRTEIMRQTAVDLGLLYDGVEFREIGGWEYARIVPPGGRDAPPLPRGVARVVLPVAARTVPAMRRRTAAASRALRDDVAGTILRRWWEEQLPALESRLAPLRHRDVRALDDAGLAAHLRDLLELVDESLRIHFRLHPAIALELALLCRTGRELLGWDDTRILGLLSGSSTRSTAPARALAALARTAGPAAREALRAGAGLGRLQTVDPGFAAAVRGYLAEHGCRALSYDVADPALDELPDVVLRLLRDQLDQPDEAPPGDPVAAVRARVQAELRRELSGAALTRAETAFERGLLAYPAREDNEYVTASIPLGLLRRALVEIGRRAVAQGVLTDPVDITLLFPAEVLDLLGGTSPAPGVVERRKGERAWALAHPGPDSYGPARAEPPPLTGLPKDLRTINEAFLWTMEQVIGGAGRDPATDGDDGAGPDADADVVTGTAASPGRFTGTVRVIRSEAEFHRLRHGDVLVCPVTSPVWSVLFPSVGALVTDHGGVLSHPAIIAREFGVPAVVATGDGTARLPDGATVTVDGAQGTVRIASAP